MCLYWNFCQLGGLSTFCRGSHSTSISIYSNLCPLNAKGGEEGCQKGSHNRYLWHQRCPQRFKRSTMFRPIRKRLLHKESGSQAWASYHRFKHRISIRCHPAASGGRVTIQCLSICPMRSRNFLRYLSKVITRRKSWFWS